MDDIYRDKDGKFWILSYEFIDGNLVDFISYERNIKTQYGSIISSETLRCPKKELIKLTDEELIMYKLINKI
jgi:hypothetical protein